MTMFLVITAIILFVWAAAMTGVFLDNLGTIKNLREANTKLSTINGDFASKCHNQRESIKRFQQDAAARQHEIVGLGNEIQSLRDRASENESYRELVLGIQESINNRVDEIAEPEVVIEEEPQGTELRFVAISMK